MSGYLTGRALWVQDLSGSPKLTLLALTDAAHDDGSHCFPGHVRLAAMVGVSERQVRRILADLKARGFVDWSPRWDAKGNRSSNVYRINIDRLPHPPRTPEQFEALTGRPVTAARRQEITGHGRPVITGHSGSDNRTFHAGQPDIAMSGDPPDRPASIDPPTGRAREETESGFQVPAGADPIPDQVPVEPWTRFEQHRAEVIGRPLNNLARRTIWAKLIELPTMDARAAALDAAVARGYREPVYPAGLESAPARPPFDPGELATWAKARGLPAGRPGESVRDYRSRLVAIQSGVDPSGPPPSPPPEPEDHDHDHDEDAAPPDFDGFQSVAEWARSLPIRNRKPSIRRTGTSDG